MSGTIPESHPLSTVLSGALLAAATILAREAFTLALVLVCTGAALLCANVHSGVALRRLRYPLLLSNMTLALFLLLLLGARWYAQSRMIWEASGSELMTELVMPILRLNCGAGATICIIAPFFEAGGLRRVLALGLPAPLSVLTLATIANFYLFQVSIERVVTAHYATGAFKGSAFGAVRKIPAIAARVWSSVAVSFVEAFDFKWRAHDIEGLIQEYAAQLPHQYGRIRSLGVLIWGLTAVIHRWWTL